MSAECMFLRAGDGTWSGSAKIMIDTLAKAYGLSPDSLQVRDGGGLSRGNRVTADAVTKILAALARGEQAHLFLDSLPISGTDGRLRRRMAKDPYRGRVLGKTGYIAGVSCLSGYVLDRARKPALAYSILVNDVPSGKGYLAKRLQDDLCRMMVDLIAEK